MTTAICGTCLILLYLFIRYRVNRRRFGRRGIAGLQQFRSYRHFVVVATLESIVMIAAKLCGLAGLVLLAAAGFNHLKIKP
ncbi:hypothetical protein BC343_19400 [Mucilaginibacter pedocola]|uniref:Uncharacterized protein n=2 Tax=Mucilaginibacter pedocola TaxID=1792845 RepID=A0A1S9P6Y6_9SPHI|nr:hypothetical protein BC343_19400 [Mucilaginibacter pedocola]